MGLKWKYFENDYPSTYTFTLTNKIQTNIECPKCGEYLFERTDIVLATYPAQYQYECACGFVGYSRVDWQGG